MQNDKHDSFIEHTKERLDTPELEARFSSLKAHCEPLIETDPTQTKVLDIGCGMGVQSLLWARDGYQVTGMDIDSDLFSIGRARAQEMDLEVEWVHASAAETPLPDRSFDVCLSIELLEHVPEWQACVDHMCRVLKPGGLLLLTSTNSICPKQSEFNLPFYSWWPGFLKRKMEKAATSTNPAVANYTDFPAVNWFTFFQLRKILEDRGFEVKDRFDVMFLDDRPFPVKWVIKTAQRLSMVRAFLYLFVEGVIVYAVKVKE